MFGEMLAIEHPFDTMPLMDRAIFLKRRALVALGLAVMVGPWVGQARAALSQPATVSVSRQTYVVRPGDTLWTIAEDLAPDSEPRPLMDAIARANGLGDGVIDAGQALVIPER